MFKLDKMMREDLVEESVLTLVLNLVVICRSKQ